ncbi:hypothetical protein F5144DRAFT_591862 [Chaetomium tenue]|uniref:Uncharacterized protein n=1 Tax=Chaetomium tenue TaxID=1854479 RepID=A0ACB7PDJ3_9PEZI|nr:hypothetical protein F5144DRAFT_591862 [Chaetomium globosum]
MDLDIEMDVDDVHNFAPPTIPEAYTQDLVSEDEQEPGEVEEAPNHDDNGDITDADKAVVPYKVHIKGLDTFNPDHVKGYLAEHYTTSDFNRVEWIDDTSANFIFKSESAAQEALVALAAVEIADATQLPPLEVIPAKGFSQKPESTLRIRFAVEGDRKAARASERSRFYLLHPEYDPEERRRRGEFGGRGKYRDRDDRYRSDRRSDRRRDPRDDEEPETFDINFYDDDPPALATRTGRSSHPRRRSESSSSDTRRAAQRNREKELFPSKLSGGGRGLRDRSASPVRDRDGDAEMDLDEDARAAAALRSREKGRSIKERLSRNNNTKELFPSRDSNRTRELFPAKAGSSVGSRAQMDQVGDTTVLASDRITAPGTSGFNIRGIANKRGSDQGIAIKGMGPNAKELFPEKFGNAGKELFAEKIEGRARRRQKAEDMFY